MIVRKASASFLSLFTGHARLIIALLAAAVVIAGTAGQATADSRYAAYVLDANTGKVLFARNADARRYPASLTKMMTIYLIFEAIEAGRISAKTPVPFSKNAAGEPPTKLGVKPGGSITIDTAIRALVTRSANDVSTAVAELLGGSEANFARMMTAKAKQLGMSSTQFRNAHGLPNGQQYTTARDMAILGVALREHFPRRYDYFSTRSFAYGKQRISTHNRMFGRIKGVDGIKTGYTRASGFNLVTSVQSDGRSVVAVVMGGKSARSRDDHMAALLREHLPRASRKDNGPLVASRTLTPGTTAVAAAAVSLPRKNIPMPAFRPTGEGVEAAATVAAYAPTPAPNIPVPSAAVPVPSAPVPVPAALDDRFSDDGAIDPMQTASTRPTGWAVQIASSPSQNEAFAALVRTGKEASGVLGSANAFIEEFENKGTLYYRARFGGFASKTQAWNACNALKKRKIDCFAAQL
ncbi:MAG: D-alanyl-D-alanine carboxypeptidase [Hyphomicrobiales bacterium]|nr:MAG: D-alanyl-D-alanine carboxypeptidase [Hyphomicrobiales bacterium]